MTTAAEVREALSSFSDDTHLLIWVGSRGIEITAQPERLCANETCCKSFVFQEGRAKHGPYHTTGVLYCSRACARAQAQREYRRRRKAARVRVLPAPAAGVSDGPVHPCPDGAVASSQEA